jgi:hypothetical protein
MPRRKVGIARRINVANSDLRLLPSLSEEGTSSIMVEVKSITDEEMNGIKTIYNPDENSIEQNFSKLGPLSASLPPT